MVYSMTGFATFERESINGILTIELRSVNHRYLELHFRLDDHLRSFEPFARELIASKLGRGKVECRMSLIQSVNGKRSTELDGVVLQQLAKISAEVQRHFPQSAPVSVAEILRWPGVLVADEVDQEALAAEVEVGLTQALQDMTDSRAREGAKLKAVILERLAEMEQRVAQVRHWLPLQIKAYQERLTGKLQEAIKTIDEERIHQELVLFAQRADVDEELSRLTTHMEEVRRVLGERAAAGKRLDFLMQELNREANTLGSKSVSTEVSQASMALKVLIEQMREQIQNIE